MNITRSISNNKSKANDVHHKPTFMLIVNSTFGQMEYP